MRVPMPLQLLSQIFGFPRFRFNKKLFGELIREAPDGKNIEASAKEPDVVFEVGRPSDVLGTYNPETKRITIEVLSNYLACLAKGDVDLRKRFDERLTTTLAHEGGHWQLDMRHGLVPMIEKIAIHVTFSLLGIFIAARSSECPTDSSGIWSVSPGAAHPILPILETIGFAVVFSFVGKTFFEFWNALTFGVTYRLCYAERYARSFEKRPETDERWKDVVILP